MRPFLRCSPGADFALFPALWLWNYLSDGVIGAGRLLLLLRRLRVWPVQKASEYHLRAEECRAHAARLTDAEHKELLLRMAETWETLAMQREELVARRERIAAIKGPNDITS